jgi:hypothetical protein
MYSSWQPPERVSEQSPLRYQEIRGEPALYTPQLFNKYGKEQYPYSYPN